MSPGFHSTALLVHISGLWVAIRRGLSTFQFLLLCLDPTCDVVCQHFSSASLALLFLYSIQSSKSSSWLAVLSSSYDKETLLSWSYSSFVLSSFLCIFTHFVILDVFDESEHSALGSAEHSIVFFLL